MKNLALILLAALCGCKTTGLIAIPSPDGTRTNYYPYAGVGGIVRPGIMIVWDSNTNGPPVQAQGIGSPIAPSILGVAAHVGGGLAVGSTLRPDEHNETTVIQGEPRAPMIEPPPPARPPTWRGPPFGHPHNPDRPHNRGR